VNRVLVRTTGYQLTRKGAAAPPARRAAGGRAPAIGLRAGDRLVEAPVFVMCTLRSGSTLLRVLLGSHSQLHATQELHLRGVSVGLESKWAELGMGELGLDRESLEYLLWDRVLHRELAASGKRHLVTKTPSDVFIADRIRACWPDARFVFLLRHPAAIARSRANLRPDADAEQNLALIARYGRALEAARRRYDGITVRYEDVTADPAAATQRLCAHLGVPWEAGMVEYGAHDHGRFKAGLGDWADKIRTGAVQPPEPPPAEVPEPLRELAVAWGYLPGDAERASAAVVAGAPA
jgi:hypothetical protein